MHPQASQVSNAGATMPAIRDLRSDIQQSEDRMAVDSGDRDSTSGNDLPEDLQDALERDLNFKGSYAYGGPCPQVPNPCLQIEGLGLIGIPLSERDAKLIIQCAEQAPYCHGDQTLVDKQVRDTWEIESTRVTFGNPAWDASFAAVMQSVCTKLGVGHYSTAPRCELYKLLLYEPGSQ